MMSGLFVEGKKAFSAPAPASAVVFHICAMDKSTVETMKEKLTQKSKDLVKTVEIKEDGIRRLNKHLTDKIKSLSTSDVTVDIGMNVDCCMHHFDIF